MRQSQKYSVLESLLNTASGFMLSWLAGFLIFPLFGFLVSARQNAGIVGAYTVLSILRNYAWRRIFNWWSEK